MEKKVLDDWLLLEYGENVIPIETRVHLLPELLRLAGEVTDGHLNSTRIMIDDRNMRLFLNDDKDIQDEYASPEVLNDCMTKSFVSAVFSVGILIDEFARGSSYAESNGWSRDKIDEDMKNKKGDSWIQPTSDDPLVGIIRSCTAIDIEARPQTITELRQVFLANDTVQEYWNENEEQIIKETVSDEIQKEKNEEEQDCQKNTEEIKGTNEAVVPVGIDLGTSYSTVAYYKDGKIRFLEVRQQNSIPSAIFFENVDRRIYGQTALSKGQAYPESLFKHFKRHMGETKKLSFRCHNQAKAASDYTYVIDTNVFIDDPQVLDGIETRHRIVVPRTVYEELGFRQNDDNTVYQAKAALSTLDEYKDRIIFEESHEDLLPKDFFRSEDRTNNNRNDNKILSIALYYDSPETILVTSDNVMGQTKAAWLRKQDAKFQVMKLKEFQFHKTAKIDDPADIQLTGKDGAVLFLKYMRGELEKDIGPVSKAVITVPQLFNAVKCEETKEAALEAGFSEVELRTEPVAAAVAYGLDQVEDKNILVYDFGGGTFDIAIIRHEQDDFHVLGTGGDPKLGGEDFTNALAEEFMERLQDEYDIDMFREEGSGLSHEEFAKNREQILSKCERLKCNLSYTENADEDIKLYTKPGVRTEVGFSLQRNEFEDIVGDLVAKSRKALDDALSRAGLQRNDIDLVIMAGGTSTIPCIREFVEHYFGQAPYADKDTATLIAAGAAAFADMKWNQDTTIQKKIRVFDKTADDFGVSVKGNKFDCIIPAGQDLPRREKPKDYSLVCDNQQELNLKIFTRRQGSQAIKTMDDDISFIGTVAIKNLPPLKRDEAVVRVTFELTKEYIFDVSVEIINNSGQPIKAQSVRIDKVGV